MKLMKKIASIMLAVMMVLGMCSVVGAAESGSGSITISNTVKGQTYKVYRILDLESYSKDNGNYAYKLRGNEWDAFIKSPDIAGKYVTVEGEYVKGIAGINDTDAAKFTELATKYAEDNNINPESTETATESIVVFNNLPLGYYLVESSMGALCALDTTNPDMKIQEKNGTPSVKKEVEEDSKVQSGNAYGESNTADIGQTVNFRTTITAQAGAKNYVLHDKMSAGLTFERVTSVKIGDTEVESKYYTVVIDSLSDDCTFHIEFTPEFCSTLQANQQIIVTYTAVLNKDAVIAGSGNENETWLGYGDGSTTAHDKTTTKTYEIPVFKYTMSGETEKGLANAVFTLSKNSDGSNPIKLVKTSKDGATDLVYRVAMEKESGVTEITTPASGNFTIKGLDADTYYLTEIEAPEGYNKLTSAVRVVISEDGTITVNNSSSSDATVKIENKTGSMLPSTGGMGTKIFYLLGAVLVIGSGVVLITKRRMK